MVAALLQRMEIFEIFFKGLGNSTSYNENMEMGATSHLMREDR